MNYEFLSRISAGELRYWVGLVFEVSVVLLILWCCASCVIDEIGSNEKTASDCGCGFSRWVKFPVVD